MTTSMNLTSAYRRRENSNARVVPAAAVWEPGAAGRPLGSTSNVRTLAPYSYRTPNGVTVDSPQPSLSNAQALRREHRRTYLMGALLGFTIVAGSLHLLAQEDSGATAGYADTITADIAK